MPRRRSPLTKCNTCASPPATMMRKAVRNRACNFERQLLEQFPDVIRNDPTVHGSTSKDLPARSFAGQRVTAWPNQALDRVGKISRHKGGTT